MHRVRAACLHLSLLLVCSGALASGYTLTPYQLLIDWSTFGTDWQVSTAIGDFDGDGRSDLVTAGSFGVSVHLQQGDGTLAPPFEYRFPFEPENNPIFGMQVADFDGDGRLDVLLTAGNAGLVVLRSTPTGHMWLPAVALPGLPSAAFVLADVDGDGHLDAVGHVLDLGDDGSPQRDWIVVLFGDSRGNFSRPWLHRTDPLEAMTINDLVAGDIDGDGRADVVVIRRHPSLHGWSDIAVYFAEEGGFAEAPLVLGVGGHSAVAIADMDMDGLPDVLVSRSHDHLSSDQIRVFRQSEPRMFEADAARRPSLRDGAMLLAGDVNGDGGKDLVMAFDGLNQLGVYLHDADYPRQPDFVYLPFPARSSPPFSRTSLSIGDLDGDGVNDAALAGGSVGVMLLRGAHGESNPSGRPPARPTNTTAVIDHSTRSARVQFQPPQDDGGLPITKYTVHSIPDGGLHLPTLDATALEHELLFLDNDTEYSFVVRAHNVAGAGPASAPSSAQRVYDTPGISASDAIVQVGEGARLRFRINLRDPALSGGARFLVETVDGTARAGEHYIPSRVELEVPPGGFGVDHDIIVLPTSDFDREVTLALHITPIFGIDVDLVVGGVGRITAPAPKQMRTGAWWIPAESGWGLLTFDQGNVIGVGWFTFDHDGKPTWFVGPALPVGADTYHGHMHRHFGVPYAATAGSAVVSRQPFADFELDFSGPGALEFAYTLVDGTRRVRPMFALSLGASNPICRPADGEPVNSDNYTAIWWPGPEADGWGLFLFHIGDAAHGLLYTYDGDGEAVFYVGNMTADDAGGFAGPAYRQHDGTPLTEINMHPPSSGADVVGNWRFLPHSDGGATFEFDGVGPPFIRQVERFQFGDTVAVCSG